MAHMKIAARWLWGVLVIAVVASLGVAYRWPLVYSFLWVLSPGGDFAAVDRRPDYMDLNAWAAHPQLDDAGDKRPRGVKAASAGPDRPAAFYIHPTTYISSESWNQPQPFGDRDDLLDGTLLANQASVFHGCCDVYAPRYRQATFYAFADRRGRGEKALALAFRDVAAAFDAFIGAIGPDRPIVLAGHSQGSAHLLRLLSERFRGTPLTSRLVVAYAPGYPVPLDSVTRGDFGVPACSAREAVGCLSSWNVSTRKRYIPEFFKRVPIFGPMGTTRLHDRPMLCDSPLDWSDVLADARLSGGLLRGQSERASTVACGSAR